MLMELKMNPSNSPEKISQSFLIALDQSTKNLNFAERQVRKRREHLRSALRKGVPIEAGDFAAVLVEDEPLIVPPQPMEPEHSF